MKKKNHTYLLQTTLYSMIASAYPVFGETLTREHSDHYSKHFGSDNQSGDALLEEISASVDNVRATIKKEVDARTFPDELLDLIISSLTSNPKAIQHIESFHSTGTKNGELNNFLTKLEKWVTAHYVQDKEKTRYTLNTEIHKQYPDWPDTLIPYAPPSVAPPSVTRSSVTRSSETPPSVPLPISTLSLAAKDSIYGEDATITISGGGG